MKVFWFAFAGRTFATLFVAICTALTFGPSEWAALLLGAEPTVAVRLAFGISALVTTVYIFGPLIIRTFKRMRSRVTTGPLQIAVSEIRQRSFSNYAGFVEGNSPSDAQLISYGEVTIANISSSQRVALDLALRIHGNKINLSEMADLRGPFGLLYGTDDIASKALKARGIKRGEFHCNPVTLDPQQIARGNLVFIFDYGDLRDKITSMMLRDDVKFSLEIKDHLSGYFVEIPIPGEYRAST